MKKGVSQVIATALMLIIAIALALMAYLYITNSFGTFPETKPKPIDCNPLKEKFNYDYCEYYDWKIDYGDNQCCCYYNLYNFTYALDKCYDIEEK